MPLFLLCIYFPVAVNCTKFLRGYGRPNSQSIKSFDSSNSPLGISDDGNLISAYIPQCRPDRPDLFIARQCTKYDCFCVNVTTGETLLGTRASPSEVGDCSTAIYSVTLAILLPKPATSSNDLSSLAYTRISHEQDSAIRTRIEKGLQSILRSAPGFQRVLSVTRLDSVPGVDELILQDLVFYRAKLSSTGHQSLKAPQDLVQHRLHEGFVPEIGSVDPDLSEIKLENPKVPDPLRLEYTEIPSLPPLPSSPAPTLPVTVQSHQLPTHQNLIEPPAPGPNIQENSHKIVRSPEPEPSAAVVATAADKPVERDLRHSAPLDPSEQIDTSGFESSSPKAARQIYGQNNLLQGWPDSSSRAHVLSQPGVIAGIVGGVLVVLLLLILLILFCIYRLRKKDEGSYALDEPKKIPTMNAYTRAPTREFYA